MYLDNFIKRASKNIFSYEEPLQYLYHRGLDDKDIHKYSLGYTKFASFKENGSEDYKLLKEKTLKFKGLQKRLLFPLKNMLGHTNGIVVRDLHKKMYVQVFFEEAKRIGGFFGLYEAIPHILKTGNVFVHEGAIDCISFSKIFPNSISTLTSFISESQFETLRFFAENIILVFDNDGPGKLGVFKIKEQYGDRHIHSIDLGYNDSNQCLQRLGLEGFRRYIKSRIPLLFRQY